MLGEQLEPLRGGFERTGDFCFDRDLPLTDRYASLANAAQLVLRVAETPLGFRILVGHGDRRHNGQALVADLAETLAELLDCAGKAFTQCGEVRLLPVVASHPVGPAGDDDVYLGHVQFLLRTENVADGFHRRDQPAGHFAVDLLQAHCTRLSGIQRLRQTRAVGDQPVHFCVRVR